jgi:predicted dehydrogenase
MAYHPLQDFFRNLAELIQNDALGSNHSAKLIFRMQSVGLIGCGAVANEQYATVLRTQFAGYAYYFYDTNSEAAATMAQSLKGQAVSLENLISKSDFIIITTPPHTHYELLIAAIKPGKRIVCEKPFLLKSNEALRIVELSRTENAQVFAAHMRRFFAAPLLARNFLATGLLGKVNNVDVFEGGRFTYHSHSGYHFTSPLGGVLPDTGSHSLDTLLFVLGVDERELTFERTNKTTIPVSEPSHVFKADFTINTDDSIRASISLSRREYLANKINIFCEKGIMEVPLDLKNAVKITTAGKTILRENNPAESHTDAFYRQFHHILHENGELLQANRFINTTKLLETLLKD